MEKLVKGIVAFFLLLALCNCAGSGSGSGASSSSVNMGASYLTLPRSGELVILGVSARQSSRSAEINNAREDAARKASMYHGFSASVESIQDIGTGYLDYFVSSETYIVYDNQIEWYKERLSFDPDRDVVRNNDGAVFIKFSYPVPSPYTIDYHFRRNPDGSPEWISRSPQEIGGFKTGIGYSGRLERLNDTVRRSYETAAAAILSYYYSTVESRDSVVAGQSTSRISSQSKGRLDNFIILDIWIDPKSRGIYTLAIARKAE